MLFRSWIKTYNSPQSSSLSVDLLEPKKVSVGISVGTSELERVNKAATKTRINTPKVKSVKSLIRGIRLRVLRDFCLE